MGAPTYSRDHSAPTYLVDPCISVVSPPPHEPQLPLESIPESYGTLVLWELLRTKNLPVDLDYFSWNPASIC